MAEVTDTIRRLCLGDLHWEEVTSKYPLFETAEEEEKDKK
jgi:hypothetical protein